MAIRSPHAREEPGSLAAVQRLTSQSCINLDSPLVSIPPPCGGTGERIGLGLAPRRVGPRFRLVKAPAPVLVAPGRFRSGVCNRGIATIRDKLGHST
jgi:hypothetical protein